MSVAIKKVSGVDSVKVSLNEGLADIKLKEGNKVNVEQIREVIRSNGFTPKEAEVQVAGKVIERSGKPALEISGPDQVYVLELQPDAKVKIADLQKMIGQQAVVSGQVPETSKEKSGEPRTLLVRDLQRADTRS